MERGEENRDVDEEKERKKGEREREEEWEKTICMSVPEFTQGRIVPSRKKEMDSLALE
jgi:hypothetical protein